MSKNKIVLEGSLDEIKAQLYAMESEKRKECRHVDPRKKGDHSLLVPINPTKRESTGIVGHNLMKCKRCGTIIDMDNLTDDTEEFSQLLQKVIDNFEFIKIYDKNFKDKEALSTVNWIEDSLWELNKRHRKAVKRIKGGDKKKKKKSFFNGGTVDRSVDLFGGLKSKNKKKSGGNPFYR